MNAINDSPYIIGVDHGNKQIKTANTDFISGFKKADIKPAVGSDIILYNGKYYSLTNDRISFMKDKTKDNQFFILNLFALVKELKARNLPLTNAEIALGVGLPPEHLETLGSKFKDYFPRKDYIEFKYNNEPVKLHVNRTYVYPQAYSAAVPYLGKISSYPVCYLIDIGGYTVDVIELNYGVINAKRYESLETGVIPMYDEIIHQLRSKKDALITEEQIDNIILDKTEGLFFTDENKEFVVDSARTHFNDIINSLREKHIDLKNNYTIFAGGGTILLKRFMKNCKAIGPHLVIKDIHANAKGYEILMQAQMQQKG